MKPEEGRYAISEVGDLGLGLTPINETEENNDQEDDQETELV